MKQWYRRGVSMAVALVLICALLGFPGTSASADPVPRILLAGDSWTGFLLAFRSFREVLPEYEGLERWIEVGNRTAEMGARVWEMLERNYLEVLTEELTVTYPNADIVVMTLGGNDILRGIKGVDPRPGQENRTVSIRTCFNNNPTYEPWDSTDQCMEWLADQIELKIGIVIDHILSIRPDIRVVILSYDYAAREPRDEGYTVLDQHLAFIDVEMAKRQLALARPRVEYVNNFGLMQHLYGIPTGRYPTDGFPPEDIAPGVAPYPCDAPVGEDPTCGFWPGGMPQYLAPEFTYIDNDIHLEAFGYADIARRAVDAHIETWLNYPKALEILPLDNKAIYQFQVTFSHPVSGVTESDFEVFINTKFGMKSMDVIGVAPASGTGDVYIVTVDMGASYQAAYIRVLDDDSIVRIDTGEPLGGLGLGNGLFEYNGTYVFQDIPQPDDDDFAGALQFLYMASQAYEHLLAEVGFSFAPETFDANGNLLQDGSIDDPIIIPGNSLLDLYEFMVLDAILKRPDYDMSARNGANYAAVKYAWDNNIAAVQTALGGVGGLADTILPGIDTVLAGFLTLGDRDSAFLVSTLVTLLGTIEEFPTNVTPSALPFYDQVSPDPEIFLRRWLSLTGDADGDGWRNFQEYAYFAPDGVAAYVNAALDPHVQPKTGEGRHRTGDFVRIAVLERVKFDSTFQWYRNGVPVADKDQRIVGTDTRAMDILSILPGDAGAYTCVFTRPNGTQATYGPIQINVRDGAVPVGGAVALALATVALGLLGGHRLMRRQ